MRRSLTVAMLGALCVLPACGDGSQSEKEQAARRDAEELALMRDTIRAGPEIERRLRERIEPSGSIVIVKEFGSLRAIPVGSAWSATCGFGLSVVIAAAGDNEGIQLNVSDAFFGQEDCKILLPITAAKVSDVLAGKEKEIR